MTIEAFLAWKWFNTGFSKKWGYTLLVTIILVIITGRMVKIEQITKRDFNILQTQNIESHKKLPPKVTDDSFIENDKNTKSIDINFVNAH